MFKPDLLERIFGPDPEAVSHDDKQPPRNPLKTAVEIAMDRFGIDQPEACEPVGQDQSVSADQAYERLLELHELEAERRFQMDAQHSAGQAEEDYPHGAF